MTTDTAIYPRVIWRKGKLVFLGLLEEADQPQFHQAINNYDTSQYLLRTGPVGAAAQKKWYERVCEPSDSHLTMAICLLDGTLIGNMALHNIDLRNRTAVTAAMIMYDEHRGKGYGTDAKMLLLAYAFMELDLYKVRSDVISFNSRSAAYSKKCGYVEEGRLKGQVYRNSERHDLIQLAVFKDDWLARWETYQKESSV